MKVELNQRQGRVKAFTSFIGEPTFPVVKEQVRAVMFWEQAMTKPTQKEPRKTRWTTTAADSSNARVRLKADNDRLQQDVAQRERKNVELNQSHDW